jgi:hypothetical protein
VTSYFLRVKQGYRDVVRTQDDVTVFIPLDEGNSDYQQYLAWVAEGNTATEWLFEA